MPCYYTDSREGDAALATKEFAKDSNRTITGLTRLLCATCTELEDTGLNFPTTELREWWEDHKKLDAKRKKRSDKRGLVEGNKRQVQGKPRS